MGAWHYISCNLNTMGGSSTADGFINFDPNEFRGRDSLKKIIIESFNLNKPGSFSIEVLTMVKAVDGLYHVQFNATCLRKRQSLGEVMYIAFSKIKNTAELKAWVLDAYNSTNSSPYDVDKRESSRITSLSLIREYKM